MQNNPEYLIKIWGSLMQGDETMRALIKTIEDESVSKTMIVTTGSKDLSNVIRRYVAEILPDPISVETHVEITMQSRDMMARAFSHASSIFSLVNSVSWINDALSAGKVPILLQYDLLKSLQPFAITRGLSTDTTSAYFADLLKVGKFIKLTDVDGVYEKLWEWCPYSTISTSKLRSLGQTCIDITLADLLDRIKMCCYVVNGRKISNLTNFLQYWTGVHTCIHSL